MIFCLLTRKKSWLVYLIRKRRMSKKRYFTFIPYRKPNRNNELTDIEGVSFDSDTPIPLLRHDPDDNLGHCKFRGYERETVKLEIFPKDKESEKFLNSISVDIKHVTKFWFDPELVILIEPLRSNLEKEDEE